MGGKEGTPEREKGKRRTKSLIGKGHLDIASSGDLGGDTVREGA